jgi:anti-sigma regulatory factor (Ser/Thr protein kinase)
MADAASRFACTYPAEPASIAEIRHAMLEFAATVGVTEAAMSTIALAVTEAATNAVLHAYREMADRGTVSIRAQRLDGALHVEVTDEGRGIAPRLDSPGAGLGLPLLAQLTSHLEIDGDNPTGTTLHMRFDLAG